VSVEAALGGGFFLTLLFYVRRSGKMS